MQCCKVVSALRAIKPQHAACAAAARTLLLPWRRQQQQHAKAGTSSTRRRATTTIAKVCVCVRCQASFACPESVGQGDGHTAGAEHRNTERSYAPPRRASFLAKLLPCSSAHSLLSARPPPKRLPAQADHNAAAAAADDGGLDNDVSLRVTFSFLKRGREVFSASGCAGSGGDALSAFNEVLPLVLKRGGALQGGPGPAAPAAAAAAAATTAITAAADAAAADDDATITADTDSDADTDNKHDHNYNNYKSDYDFLYSDDEEDDDVRAARAVPPDATHVFFDGMLCKVVRIDGAPFIDAPKRRRAELRGLGGRAVTLAPFKNAIEGAKQLRRLDAVYGFILTDGRSSSGDDPGSADFEAPDESPVFKACARKHLLLGPHVLPVFQLKEGSDDYQYVKIDRATMRAINAASGLHLKWPRPGVAWEGERTMQCDLEEFAELARHPPDVNYAVCAEAWLH